MSTMVQDEMGGGDGLPRTECATLRETDEPVRLVTHLPHCRGTFDR